MDEVVQELQTGVSECIEEIDILKKANMSKTGKIKKCEDKLKTTEVESKHSQQFSVQCSVFSVQCSVFSVQCSVFSVQCSVFSVQCSVFSVQCSVFSVQCSVFSPVSFDFFSQADCLSRVFSKCNCLSYSKEFHAPII